MRKVLIFFILFFSAAYIYADNYFTLIAHIGSTPTSFAFASNDVMFAGTLGSGVYKSEDYGNTWIQLNNGLTDLYVYSLVMGSNGILFAGTENGSVFFTSNYGANWIKTSLIAASKVKALAIAPSGSIFAGADGDGIFRSQNNGSSWEQVKDQIAIYTIAVNNNGVILAGAGVPDEGVFRSTDGGNTWVKVLITDHNVNSIALNYAGTVFAATGNLETLDNPLGDILARSRDAGNTWDFFYLFGSSSYGLVINSLGHLFLGRYRFVWVSESEGVKWVIQNSGLETSYGMLISYGINSQGFLYAGQEGGYIYRTTFNTIGIKKLGESVPLSFNLYQNYPNPFNPITTIKFDIPFGAKSEKPKVKILIYDVLGRQVAELFNKDLAPGTYTINWDATNYPSGVYFCRLTMGAFVTAKKMIMSK
jgi:ligand-binding sensor domain-containing protein